MRHVGLSAACLAIWVAGCAPPCGDNTVDRDGTCVPAYPRLGCGAGTVAQNGECVAGFPKRECGAGTVELQGKCVLDSNTGRCSTGTVLRGELCVEAAMQHVGLPFPTGTTVTISQGLHSASTHQDSDISRYAVDFAVPEGTAIVAARGGIVWQVKQDSTKGCPDPSCAADANYVRIDHGDATFGNYLHLKVGGARVKVGDVVCRGQPVGLSGNTGWSTGPHLHFSVTSPLADSLPVAFDELSSVPSAIAGSKYTSQNVDPGACKESYQHSTCPADLFLHLGVLLDRGAPCAVAKVDTPYPVTGQTLVSGSKIRIARQTAAGTWDSDCVSPDASGRFSATLSWPAPAYQGHTRWDIGAADAGCSLYQSTPTPYIVLSN